jgi:hypothetical protein
VARPKSILPLLDRFEAKYTPEPNSGCWLWTASRHRQGYGQMQVDGRPVPAHRVAYELFVGPIPAGQCVCHKCDVPACVNPEHLWLGTVGENNTDRNIKGRTNRPVGDQSSFARFTWPIVREMRQRFAAGASRAELREAYGISANALNCILRGETWPDRQPGPVPSWRDDCQGG